MTNFWHDLPRPFFALAPLEAVTDVVFRHVVAAAAPPDLYFTEFTNATGWVHAGDRAVGGRLVKTNDEHPIVAQLWGADADAMEQMAIHCAELGYAGIDINMGCPDSSAVKSGGGAGMIRDPKNATAMIEAAKKSGLPVSVKTRLGYSSVDEWDEWIGHLLEQDVTNITVHLRTKKEMSKVPAHFELVPKIKNLRDEISPNTLITINGDIRDREHGLELVSKYGIDGIMIGRGVFQNPFAFSKDVNVQESHLFELLRTHLDLYDKYCHDTNRPFDTLKRFFKIYIHGFEGAAELRDKLMHSKSTDEVRDIISNLA